MIRVFGDARSGNCYKVQLTLALLGTPYDWVPVDIMKQETRTTAFQTMNPAGKVPVLETTEGEYLAESNAIIHYLAEGSALLPTEPLQHARVLQWMFFEQYSHEPYIAVARYIIRYLGRPADQAARLESRMAPGYAALDVMEGHLGKQSYFVGERLTIADVALYAYTHMAEEGDFDLSGYPAVNAWLARIAAADGYLPIGHDAA